ncbi:flagellar basal-body MS-ring/collar protein FliF [Candidatus Clostridium radicumherbarum]|uniref:Flagellar M-ring protein n=1 Tax=Candidatus Clostridium radicumherbarum TaxID=3381662 RepID=A0ABW8TVK0_9CLOT
MGKLSEIAKNLIGKFKDLSKLKKIALGVAGISIVVIGIYFAITLGSTKYGVLFNNLDANDAKTVMDELSTKKVTNVKVSGNSILVPADQVDQLRLELAPQISSGSKGFELFDSSSTFGTTDAEMKIKYQRALEGELEKTIKGFPQVSNVKVNLVLPDDSVFVKDSTPASASVTLMMKDGQSLTKDQVKAIVALLTGGVKNLPKENVQIVDDKMQLLTDALYDDQSTQVNGDTVKQQQSKKDYEKALETKVMDQLSKIYNKNVTVKVNADLNFDAVQSDTTTVDPKGTVVSDKYIRDTNGNVTTKPSQSPVDNNMTNSTVTTQTTNGQTVTHQEETNNYEIGKSETKTIKAPGSVKRLTASVIVNQNNIDSATQTQIQNLVANAIGIDQTRGDSVVVEGMKFDTSATDAQKQALDQMKQAQAQEAKMNLYKEIAIGGGVLVLLIMLFAFLRKKKKSTSEEEQLDAIITPKSIDVLVGDNSEPQVEFKPIDFESQGNSERGHIEKEIKRYASEKPDQVADIIKSWLAEDER